MKNKLIMTIILTVLLISLLSVNALGAGCTIDSFYYSPKIVPEDGGNVTLSFTINNNSSKTVSKYNIGDMAERECNIAAGDSQNVSVSIYIQSNMMDSSIQLPIGVTYSDGSRESITQKSIKVGSKPDVIWSTKKSTTPDSGTYHIGDTIEITDNFANRAEKDATSVTIQYYKKGGGEIVYDETKASLGTIAVGESADYTYSYTFVHEDEGQVEIASIVRYTYRGGSFEEYCVSHFYNVDDTVVTSQSVSNEVSDDIAPDTMPITESTVNNNGDGGNNVRTALLIGIIAVVAALIIAAIVVAAVLILRRSKSN